MSIFFVQKCYSKLSNTYNLCLYCFGKNELAKQAARKMLVKLTIGQDGQIAITPTLISTNEGARKRFTPVRRQCYFEDEISLSHFPVEDGYRFTLIFLLTFVLFATKEMLSRHAFK